MRTLVVLAALAGSAAADDKKGEVIEIAGMKSAAPAAWTDAPKKEQMRTFQLVAPKAAGDAADADLSVFEFPKGQGGAVKPNLDRQRAKFEAGKFTETLDEKFKVGPQTASYLDLKGTFLKKAFPMAATGTPTPNYRMLYVALETDNGLATVWLLGPEKTVEKHKAGFDEWLKNFK